MECFSGGAGGLNNRNFCDCCGFDLFNIILIYFQVVRGEGMPLSKSPGQKGDLRISFDIVFPKSLTDQQKLQLKQILPSL